MSDGQGSGFTIIAGTAHPELAAAIARALGMEPGRCAIETFPDGEVGVRLEESVQDLEVCLIQPTSPPVNDHLVELLAVADACRRAGAARITAVVPYFGYGRGDASHGRREPVTARLAADLLESAGVARILTLDAHSPQLEGFFRIPFHHLTAVPLLLEAVRERIGADAVVVSPDLGRVETAAGFAARLDTSMAVVHKRRISGAEVEAARLIGEVRDRSCLIVDDMISTGRTIVECVRALAEAGAKPEAIVAATHGVLVGDARRLLTEAGIRETWVTDTIPQGDGAWPQFRTISVAPLIAAELHGLLAPRT